MTMDNALPDFPQPMLDALRRKIEAEPGTTLEGVYAVLKEDFGLTLADATLRHQLNGTCYSEKEVWALGARLKRNKRK